MRRNISFCFIFANREIGVPLDSNPQALSLSKRQQARLGDLLILVRFHS